MISSVDLLSNLLMILAIKFCLPERMSKAFRIMSAMAKNKEDENIDIVIILFN